MMLSTRGQAYAHSGLMSGYRRATTETYNKHTNPNGEVSFSMAENFLMQDKVLNYIKTHYTIDARNITYNEGPIGALRLREAMASHLNDYFSPVTPVTAEHVTFTAGVTGLNEMIAFNLTDEGEGILLGRPIYGCFYDDMVTKSKCKAVYAAFDDVDQFSVDCVGKYEDALLQAGKDGVKVKALLICNPHNPLGKCYPSGTLRALMEFCHKYKIHLISDEVFGLSVFDVKGEKRRPFTSILSIDPKGLLSTDWIHVFYGMSKDFGAAGIRLGCLVSQNRVMTAATQAIGRFHWPSELSCATATTLLEDKAFVTEYIRESRELMSDEYCFATKLLDKAGIEYIRGGNAGFFLWINLSPYLTINTSNANGWEAEKDLKSKFLRAGVQLASGFEYKAEEPGWFRIIFTVGRDELEEGLGRIIEIAKSGGR